MISSPRPTTWKAWLSWSWIPAVVFLLTWAQASSLGLTDDEAYYWILAQKPTLGYAFHPPAVAWFIALSLKLGSFFHAARNSVAWVRLPAALCSSWVLGLALGWISEGGATSRGIRGAALVLLALAAFFGLGWMMVPDLPLFLGWMLLFSATWRICFGRESRGSQYAWLAMGSALCILSKYSGVLAHASCLASLIAWSPRERRLRALAALLVGVVVGLTPVWIWNSQHQWASILYQIRDRHAGEAVSWVRWLRFWLIELALAGPLFLVFGVLSFLRALRAPLAVRTMWKFAWVWVLPALAVFGVQPLFSDFKPHWALVAWWPMVLGIAWEASHRFRGWMKIQIAYGFLLIAAVWACCHFPWPEWTVDRLFHRDFNPKWDVANDLYGWQELPQDLAALGRDGTLPILGSRYQTASQAAFALGEPDRVSLVPRDQKAMDEWPDLHISETQGPDWPKLTRSVLYVMDNRYDLPPEYPGAKCIKLRRFETVRSGFLAKWIELWRCDPH